MADGVTSCLRTAASDKPWAEVIPLTFGRARIILTDGTSVFDSW